jgi:hypothetical protein
MVQHRTRSVRAGRFLLAAACAVGAASPARAQEPDPQILATVQGIKAIDNHAHTPALVGPGEHDDDYDALPCEPLEPTEPTLTGRADNPVFLDASRAFFDYPYGDRTPEHAKALLSLKASAREAHGDRYPQWVLDKLGIDVQLSNRVAMGRGLVGPRFRWVPFDDALLFPLENRHLAAASPDRRIFFEREDHIRASYLAARHLNQAPATLDAYLEQLVTPTLESQKAQGAVAIKFEAAYLRALDFGPADKAAAAAVYTHWLNGTPPDAAYKQLQDYLFRYVAREAGRLGLAVHIHTGYGCGGYFKLAGADPLLLESVLDDPALRKTRFVLLHGGAGPFTKEVAALLMKPNVYTDLSEQTWLLPTRELSAVVRYLLEWYPAKVLFGTDLSPGTPEIGWEEIGWQTTHSLRRAIATALTGMVADREITREQAMDLARMVLRDNALALYGWPDPLPSTR